MFPWNMIKNKQSKLSITEQSSWLRVCYMWSQGVNLKAYAEKQLQPATCTL